MQDTTAPDLTIPEDYAAECSEEHPLENAVFFDNCEGVELTVMTDTIQGAQSYVVTREFTATDACGNSTSAVQTITISDTQPPAFVGALPEDGLAECASLPEAEVLEAVDNCGNASVTLSELEIPGDCEGRFTLERTWTATDNAGNTTSHTQILTVQDLTSPELVVPDDYSASCSDVLTLDEATANDNCSAVTVTLEVDTVSWQLPQLVCAGAEVHRDGWMRQHQRAHPNHHGERRRSACVQRSAARRCLAECHAVPEAALLTASDNCADVEGGVLRGHPQPQNATKPTR